MYLIIFGIAFSWSFYLFALHFFFFHLFQLASPTPILSFLLLRHQIMYESVTVARGGLSCWPPISIRGRSLSHGTQLNLGTFLLSFSWVWIRTSVLIFQPRCSSYCQRCTRLLYFYLSHILGIKGQGFLCASRGTKWHQNQSQPSWFREVFQ